MGSLPSSVATKGTYYPEEPGKSGLVGNSVMGVVYTILGMAYTMLWTWSTLCCGCGLHYVVGVVPYVVGMAHTMLWTWSTLCCSMVYTMLLVWYAMWWAWSALCCGCGLHYVVSVVRYVVGMVYTMLWVWYPMLWV